MNAINEVLALASKGQLSGWDVGPLFQLLQGYGDAAAAAALEQYQGPYRYYAALSLGSLGTVEGVAALIRQAQNPSVPRDFTYQMLGQVAVQYPEAAQQLLDQAQRNQISDLNWTKIVAGLAGEQYQLGRPPSYPAPPPQLKTYHIASGNQNFYSLPLGPDAQIRERLALINQLLGVTSNPKGAQALQQAQAHLNGMLPR